MQDFFQIMSNFGFPVAVASYLLFRFEKKLELLEIANEEKIRRIDALVEETKSLERKVDNLNRTINTLKNKK